MTENLRAEFLSWTEAFAAGLTRCGGKGWNLARLHRYGFDVAAGGVLTAETYLQITGSPGCAKAIEALQAVPAESALSPDATAALACVREHFEKRELPRGFLADIEGFLKKTGCENMAVAVRSSATAEDGADTSFAGIHSSFLHVKDTANIAHAILKCYASLWTHQALAYRRHMGFKDSEVSCAVVLCAMVSSTDGPDPVCAGVAFTCDPTSGRRDLIVINAARGGGQSVVSGSMQPAQVVIRREARGRLSLHSRSGADSVLSDEQALRLATIACRVHWALGDGQDPQDIEWAFDGNRFWLLQARPVTAIPVCTYGPVKHLPVYWSTANIKDAIPGVVSVLSWSMIQDVVGDVLNAAAIAAGYEIPPGLEIVRRFEGHAYFDLTGMQWCLYDAFGTMPARTVEVIGGHQPEIPVPSANPLGGRDGGRRRRARLRLLKRLWGLEHELDRVMKANRKAAGGLIPSDLRALSTEALFSILRRSARLFDEIGARAGLANAIAGSWWDLLRAQLRAISGDRCDALMARLLAGAGNVTSAEHGYRTLELASAAREDEAARKWLEARHPAAEWTALPETSPFRIELHRFLDEYGHRAVYEADIMNPRWGEEPGYILDQVRHYLEQPPVALPSSARALRKRAEDEVRQLTTWRRPFIFWLRDRLQRGTALREAAKSAMGFTVMPVRLVLIEIGRRLAEGGKLGEACDIFHLSFFEIQIYLQGQWDGSGASELTADRKAQRERWLALNPPDVIVAGGHAFSAAKPPGPAMKRDGYRWAGIGVAPGRARGSCRILRHPVEGEKLRQGEILVAPSTDPGWTPLFLRASGIVMETGGYLSHGAIVAREYGIPAVVNIPGFLNQVGDGDILLVDGDHGIVESDANCCPRTGLQLPGNIPFSSGNADPIEPAGSD